MHDCEGNFTLNPMLMLPCYYFFYDIPAIGNWELLYVPSIHWGLFWILWKFYWRTLSTSPWRHRLYTSPSLVVLELKTENILLRAKQFLTVGTSEKLLEMETRIFKRRKIGCILIASFICFLWKEILLIQTKKKPLLFVLWKHSLRSNNVCIHMAP